MANPTKSGEMDLKEIQELIRMVSKSDLSELEIEKKDFKIRLKKGGNEGMVMPVQMPQAMPQMIHVPQAQTTAPRAEAPAAESPKAEAPASDANLYTFRSPMIGTFYRSSSPEKDPFVKVGDSVSPGKVMCIIEAMKLFNEIECDITGKVVKILLENAQPVEYDQPLFIIQKD